MQISEGDTFRGKLDSKGRITIPKDIRDEWQITGGDRVDVAVVGAEDGGYTCDECSDEFDLAEVAIFHRGSDDERVVCTDCLTPEDRIIG